MWKTCTIIRLQHFGSSSLTVFTSLPDQKTAEISQQKHSRVIRMFREESWPGRRLIIHHEWVVIEVIVAVCCRGRHSKVWIVVGDLSSVGRKQPFPVGHHNAVKDQFEPGDEIQHLEHHNRSKQRLDRYCRKLTNGDHDKGHDHDRIM